MPRAKRKTTPPAATPAKQVAGFIAKFDPAVAKLARGARTKLRKRFPAAVELVYDNYNALAIGFGPTERPSEAVFSLAITPRGPSLYFMHGAKLDDPDGLLQGAGNQGRFVRLTSAAMLDEPAMKALIQKALAQAKVPMPDRGRGYTIIKSISAKQRPRRHTNT